MVICQASSAEAPLTDSLSRLLFIIPECIWLILLVSPLVLVQCIRKLRSYHRPRRHKKWVRFPGHTLCWLLTILLACCQVMEVSESIMQYTWSGLHVDLIVAILSLSATLGAMFFYDHAERFNKPRLLCPLLLYWLISSITKMCVFVADLRDGYSFTHIKVHLALIGILFKVSLLGLSFFLLCHLCYLFPCTGLHHARRVHPSPDLNQLTYIHHLTSLPSRFTFHWFTSFLCHGSKKYLTLDDLGKVPEVRNAFGLRATTCETTEMAKANFERYKRILHEEQSKEPRGSPSLLRVIWRVHWPTIMASGFLKLVAILLIYVSPICVDWIVNYSAVRITCSCFFANGYILAIVVFMVNFAHTTLLQNQIFLNAREGVRCKAALQALVYDKSLRLRMSSQINTGQIMNHMSVDPKKLLDLFISGHNVWSIPLQILVGFVIACIELGVSALFAAVLMLLMIPVHYKLGGKMSVIQKYAMGQSDIRMKKVNEMLQNIKYVKLSALEGAFQESIQTTRAAEIKFLRKAAICRMLSMSLTDGLPVICCVLTFWLHGRFEDEPLNAGKAFAVLTIFNILSVPLFMITRIITVVTHARVSWRRLGEYLSSPDSDSQKHLCNSPSKEEEAETLLSKSSNEADQETLPRVSLDESENAVEIHDGQFSWELKTETNVDLKNINVAIPQGKLTVIFGGVGAGKSSLLSALLGEMVTLDGRVEWKSGLRVAYVAQTAWLMNASLKENIMFGQKFDPDLYDKVIESCALKADIAQLRALDNTEIREKGINLSGGQKKRVSLGRALYSGADVVLLDDPLSDLDTHVRSHVFKTAIQDLLIEEQGRTVVLITHHVQYLSRAHWIIHMEDGGVSFQGSLEEMQSRFAHLVENVDEVAPQDHQSATFSKCVDDTEKDKENSCKGDGKLVQEEDRERGSVPFRVYASYMRAAGPLCLAFVFCLYLLWQISRIWADFLLARWMEAEKNSKDSSTLFANSSISPSNSSSTSVDRTMWVYVGLHAVSLIILMVSMFIVELTGLKVASELHHSMLTSVLKAPMRFFDTTLIGRIINRFSNDMKTIDEQIAPTLDGVTFSGLCVLGAVVVNAVSNPIFLGPLVPILCVFILLQRFYIRASREIKRLASIANSPVLSHFTETLNGLTTIRAFGSWRWFQEKNWQSLDSGITALLNQHTGSCWIGIRLGYISAIIVLAASLCSISACLHGAISPSLVGLAIAYSVIISSLLSHLMRVTSETEMHFNSVERVIHHIGIPPERDASNEVPHEWPSEGDVKFIELSARYDEKLDPVLKNINLNISAGEKLGVCGRTGSGKSSLTLALFRMIDLCEGRILIDDVNICGIPLGKLRSSIAIIPQDPVLFNETIRRNLDLTGVKSDEELWQVLETAQLKEVIQGLPNQLDTLVTERGGNLSVGQRQLFCLARALLMDSKIMVLDEATSSIDMATEKVIQGVIHSAFRSRTVIIIAHRVCSLESCDKIIVLSKGVIIEQGSPSDLKEDASSAFAGMLEQNQL